PGELADHAAGEAVQGRFEGKPVGRAGGHRDSFSVAGAVQFGDQLLDPAADLLAGLPHRRQRLAPRVRQLPVEVAAAGDVGALVAAAHRHHDVGPARVVLAELAWDTAGEV